MQTLPVVVVQVTPKGVDRVVVEFDRRDQSQGVDFLTTLLSGLRELNRAAAEAREETGGR